MSFEELFPIHFIAAEQWQALIPLIVMSVSAVLALLAAPWKPKGRLASFAVLTAGSVLALLSLSFSVPDAPVSVLGGVLVIDRLSQIFSALTVAAGLAAAFMTLGFDQREKLLTEVYSLIAFAVVGMMILVSTRDLMVLFIGLELMSLAVYVLVGMRRQSSDAAEAGLKYFLLGGVASAILLYGVSLLYGSTGSLKFDVIGQGLSRLWQNGTPMLPVLGLVMVGIGFLFKIGAVPFHVWIPDVYTGASTPVTGFMISGVKAAAIGSLLRFSSDVFSLPGLLSVGGSFYWILWTIIAVTLLFGALVGLRQTNLKRMLAYSTITHTGYVLLGFLALIIGQESASDAIVSYTLFYVVMNLGGFSVLTLISPEHSDEPTLQDLAGLGQRRPYLAFALSLFLLSMAGIPPTAGFFGKYYLFMSAVSAGELGLTILAVVGSVISAVFYLRPLVYMYMRPQGDDHGVEARWVGSSAVVGLAAVLTLFMGFVPSWFSSLMK
ncbi:MAG TPA: NADH-quinone oxidoreductase subunit N [Oligoflexus sp.]|uniref:NADH-quinone oxidoreductase subunit N n=1 Tax=Oligoflexus sp. TaxID=1971216 RepID=UPI002D2ABC3D|nr:NADH-quinone oxidoreductase subunit N [Oligoflexus sp.]HYX35732.1 NADH-quinone oxidoreductase subunit N [Oligoflexus sp.]